MQNRITYLIIGLITTLCVKLYAQVTPVDSVFNLAYLKTGKKKFPTINFDKKTPFYIKGSFEEQKTKECINELKKAKVELPSALAIGNNYYPAINEQVKAKNLPLHYRYIPLVMSGMVNTYKDDHGRTGLWQLPYSIGVKHGLVQTRFIDERLDFKRNTKIALDHICELVQEFGDTTLGLCAYFNGIGATKHAIEKANSKDIASFYNFLPIATRDLLFNWNALSSILMHPKNGFTNKHTLESMAALERVAIEKNTHILAVGKKLDISSLTLKAINPTLVGNMMPANNYLKLPLGKATLFEKLKHSIYHYQDSVVTKPKKYVKPKPKYTPPPKGAKKVYYTVRSGDNLGLIASRNRVKISQIKGWNGLSSDRIYAGQKLIVYSKTPIKISTPKVTKTTTTSSGTYVEYTVKSGDSLWGISQKYPGVSAEDIQKLNGIGESIDIGQKLKIKIK